MKSERAERACTVGTMEREPDLTLFGLPVKIDDRVPRWLNGGMLIVPAGIDPGALLEALEATT